jgi:hypothetical protein
VASASRDLPTGCGQLKTPLKTRMHKINWPTAVLDGQKKIVDVRESVDSVFRVSLVSSLAFAVC